jgi:two-component system phosphate regulon sensor histidine kinase PhoR
VKSISEPPFSQLFPRPFPWRLLYRFLAVQVAVVLPILIVARLSLMDLIFFVAFFLVISTWLGRRFLMPLARMMSRLKEPGAALSNEEIAEESPDGWEELEKELNRMKSALQSGSADLQREREEIDILMEAIPDAILAVDSRSQLLFYNSRFGMLFGDLKKRAQPVILGEIFRTPEVLETYRAALQETSTKTAAVRLHLDTEHSPRDFALSVTPLRRKGHSGYGAVGIFHDVSELKQAERIRIDFVANVSHELRTPLTAIKGYNETLSKDIAESRYEMVGRYMEIINRNVERLMFLIEDLLDLSSLESGVEMQYAAVSTRELTGRVLAQLEQKRAAKGQLIETEFGSDFVQGDARRVEQVVINLVDNALKYMPAGKKVRIVWERDKDLTVLRVIDNGPGISAEDQSRIFERFYRVDKARSREMGGTGLGLAIVKHIMQKHSGAVRVRSTAGHGTEFICEFPDHPL